MPTTLPATASFAPTPLQLSDFTPVSASGYLRPTTSTSPVLDPLPADDEIRSSSLRAHPRRTSFVRSREQRLLFLISSGLLVAVALLTGFGLTLI